MATGDILIEITVEGGTKKSATIPSASRVNALAWMNREREVNLTDATYSVHLANSVANGIIRSAEKQLTLAAAPTTPTFTAAT
jgi:hypothetical protein|tara:strand:+ start:292 stop:540 length:249 start_codon:yes stop_codon:yes gene_type:complete